MRSSAIWNRCRPSKAVPRVGGDVERAHRLAARRIEGVQLVAGREPDMPAVISDPMHAFDVRKGAVFVDDLGC
jgi:hypothetical protein